MTEIVVSLITALFAFSGTALTVLYGGRAANKRIGERADVIVYRIEQLEKKVDKLCESMPRDIIPQPAYKHRALRIARRTQTVN